VNEADDAASARNGRAFDSAVIPSSSRACPASTLSRVLSSVATFSASWAERPRARLDGGQFIALAGRIVEQFAPLET
jgi:hypothetical protein